VTAIRITVGKQTLDAELNDTATAQAILAALPIEATGSTWGDEIYFTIPVAQPNDASAAEVVSLGDLGYWPPGEAFCIFYGRTPASVGEEIRPASAVNVVGRLTGDPLVLRGSRSGVHVRIERA
jgi:uncharacterized protein